MEKISISIGSTVTKNIDSTRNSNLGIR
jgi:hypothetical protein